MTAWETDVLPGYQQFAIELGADPEGEGDLIATLVRRGEAAQASNAVLAVHGYTDYFFNTELADRFAALTVDRCDLLGHVRLYVQPVIMLRTPAGGPGSPGGTRFRR